jgi:hypothetical protein
MRRLMFQWLILSQIPDRHRTGSVLAGRNHALEPCVFERVVLRPYRQALVLRVHGRPFGYCPGRQDPIYGQSKIIVKSTGIVFLNDKDAAATSSPHAPDRFGCFRKSSIVSICRKRHWRAFDCLRFPGGIADFASSHSSPHARDFPPLVIPQAETQGVAACFPRPPYAPLIAPAVAGVQAAKRTKTAAQL